MSTTTKPRAPYNARWNEEMDRRLAEAGVTDASIKATVEAHNARMAAGTEVAPRPTIVATNVTVVARPGDVLPASDKQCALIDALLVEREHINMTDDIIASIKANRPQASRFITFLLAQPRVRKTVSTEVAPVVEAPVAPAASAAPAVRFNVKLVPDGYYAIWVDGVVKFFRVSTSKNGVYKNVQAQASDNLFPVRGGAGIAVLRKIYEAGLEASQMLYAEKLGRCYACGRTLTDDESLKLGIGPVCREK